MSFLDEHVRDLLSQGQSCKVEVTKQQKFPCALGVISGYALEDPLPPSRLLVVPQGLTIPTELSISEPLEKWIRHEVLILHYLHIPPGNRKSVLHEVLGILEKTAAAKGLWVIVNETSMLKHETVNTVAKARRYSRWGEMGWVWQSHSL